MSSVSKSWAADGQGKGELSVYHSTALISLLIITSTGAEEKTVNGMRYESPRDDFQRPLFREKLFKWELYLLLFTYLIHGIIIIIIPWSNHCSPGSPLKVRETKGKFQQWWRKKHDNNVIICLTHHTRQPLLARSCECRMYQSIGTWFIWVLILKIFVDNLYEK